MQRRLSKPHINVGIAGILCMLLILFCSPAAYAQPLNFGSSDDPFENIPPQWWLRHSNVDIMGGVSLIGAQWRSVTHVSATLVSQELSARFAGTLRVGVFGFRDQDSDELYDAIRLVDFIKFSPRRSRSLHLRVGSTDRMRLGLGHLVNFYSSQVAWDDRTVGAEFAWQARALDIQAFTGDILLETVSGARASIAPFFWSRDEKLRSLELGVSGVLDRGSSDVLDDELRAFNGDLQFTAANIGDILITPFASVAHLENYGSGIGFGIDIGAYNFIDLARFNLRLSYHKNSDQFISGYVGSFYPVHNRGSLILKSEDLAANAPANVRAGRPRTEVESSTEVITEARVLFFENFEFWSSFKRNFGTQALSEYHLRLFFSSQRLRVSLSQDRGGLRGIFSLFNDLGDQTALTFRTDYEVSRLLWVFVSARYTYEEINREAIPETTYIVERRFEPMTGFRLTF